LSKNFEFGKVIEFRFPDLDKYAYSVMYGSYPIFFESKKGLIEEKVQVFKREALNAPCLL
jgi:hypothetical protein